MSGSITILKPTPGIRSEFVPYLILTIAYMVSGKLGLMLALPPGYSSPIFPPAGIAVAAALIGGRKTLPWIFLGSLLLNVWVGYSSTQQINTMGLTVATVIAIASMLQAAVGGWGLRRVIGYPVSLDHSGEVLRFLLLAPLVCLTSASFSVSGLMALGVIEPDSFVKNWAAWWVGDTLGVMVMLPLVLIVAGEPRALWQSRRRTVAVPMLLSFTLFVMIFLKANQWEYTDSLSDFRQLSQQAINQIENKLGEQETVLAEMAALFIHDANGHVTREEFHRFVEKSLERFPMVIQGLEWASPVDAAHRSSFETAQRKDFPGFEIRERNASGQMQRAGERASYYPVTYIEPLSGNEPALGFDLASNPERRAALNEAIQGGTAVITPAVRLMQEREQQTGVLLLLHVNPHNKESGTVLTVLRLGDFMDKLLRDTQPMLYTRLVDLEGHKTIYDNFAPGNQHALYGRTFNFGTRLYRLETAPTPAYFMQHHSWQSWSVLAAGVLGTGLLGALFLLSTGYTSRIEAQVEDRTIKLKESESRFRNILDHAPIGMAIASLDGQLMQVNHALCSMLGYTKEELEQLSIREITHPEDIDRTFASLQPLLDGAVDYYRLEKRYLRKDGQIVWGLVASSIEYDDSGASLYNIGQIEDITERKQLEMELRRSEENLNRAQAVAQVGSWVLDIPSSRLEWSAETYRMFGIPPQQAIDLADFSTVIHPEDRDFVFNAWGETMASDTPYDIEHRIVVGEQTRWVRERAEIERDSKGRLLTGIGTVQDITERKKAEQALKTESEKNLALLRNASDGIHILDAECNVIEASDSFCNLLGYQRDEMIGMNVSQWDDMFEKSELPNIFRQQYERQARSQFVTRHRRKDGTSFDVEISGLPLELDGKPVMFYSSRDITERKKADNALSESEERYRLLFDTTMDGVLLTAPDGRIFAANPSACNMFQRTEEEIRQVGRSGLVDTSDPRLNLSLEERNRTGKFLGELTLIRKDGSKFSSEVSTAIFKDKDGNARTSMTLRDISERKQAEEALRDQKEFLNTILESEPECVKVMSADGKLLQMNQAGLAMLEVDSLEEAQNEGLLSYILPEYHDAFLALGGRVFQGESGVLTFPVKGARGTLRWLETHATPLRDAKGGVVALVAVTRDITERREAEEQIHQLAYYDALTNLPNRRLLLDRLNQSIVQAKRHQRAVAVMFLDLDRFKIINDTLGHDAGDELLKEVAIRLNACVRSGDTVSRQGGDEFVIVLAEVAQQADVALVADKIIDTLAKPVAFNGQQLQVTTSIGIAMFPSNGTDDAQELMKKADIAMYAAKEAGRNRYQFC